MFPPISQPVAGIRVNPSHPLAVGLRGYWSARGASPGIIQDLACGVNGVGNNFTDADFKKGVIGDYVSFDGSSKYFSLGTGNLNIPAGARQISICARVRYNGFNHYAPIFCKRTDTQPVGGWDVGTDNTGKTAFYLNIGGSWTGFLSTNALSLGVWYNLAFTWDGNTMRSFVNGVPNGTLTTSATNAILYQSATAPVSIGKSFGSLYANMDLSYLSIYARALSHNEVKWLASSPYAMFERTNPSIFSQVVAAYNRAKAIFY